MVSDHEMAPAPPAHPPAGPPHQPRRAAAHASSPPDLRRPVRRPRWRRPRLDPTAPAPAAGPPPACRPCPPVARKRGARAGRLRVRGRRSLAGRGRGRWWWHWWRRWCSASGWVGRLVHHQAGHGRAQAGAARHPGPCARPWPPRSCERDGRRRPHASGSAATVTGSASWSTVGRAGHHRRPGGRRVQRAGAAVRRPGARPIRCGSLPDDDVALVQIRAVHGLHPGDRSGSSATCAVGDEVVAMGAAARARGPPSSAEGMVTAKGRGHARRPGRSSDLIQTDAPIAARAPPAARWSTPRAT